ncbi:thioesterase II family protein [Streptomyces zagrosensis]|uniref:Surfactin synthase thioesterase subunit n=1 Tax=Streptomyces zagrosensis TaxID=1042984 RepID=A0A7W9QBK8_9ACTN|nr:alpha/beta fold hydrolase [Streptomyces zagrosensis]MBB5937116.1 surfactin synthase thioesterase subunit [Streptomyces zagrosensis]
MSTTESTTDDLWVRRFHPVADSPHRVVLLPHAGGSASFFFPFSKALAETTDVLSVQYPGRQDRRAEPGMGSVGELADAIYEALQPWADRPLVLFGHSMGAVLGFELARRFERAGSTQLGGLIASGRRAPITYREENVHQRGDDALIAEIRALSGTDSGVLADEELLRMVLPAIRADYKAIETYRCDVDGSAPVLRCPISVLTGESDPRVSFDEAKAWSRLTTGGFTFRSFPGGHFYLTPQQDQVVAAIGEDVAAFANLAIG